MYVKYYNNNNVNVCQDVSAKISVGKSVGSGGGTAPRPTLRGGAVTSALRHSVGEWCATGGVCVACVFFLLLFPCARYPVWETHLVHGFSVPCSLC